MKLNELLCEKKTNADRMKVLKNDLSLNLRAIEAEREEKRDILNSIVEEYTRLSQTNVRFSARIADLNSKVRVPGYSTMTIAQAIAKRDSMDDMIALYNDMIGSCADRYNYEENEKPVFDANVVRKSRDAYAAARRKLDIAIQSTNWIVEIVPAEGVELPVDVVAQEVKPEELFQVVTEETTVAAPAPKLDRVAEVIKAQKNAPRKKGHAHAEDSALAATLETPKEMAANAKAQQKMLLQAALVEAQNTPRDNPPSCPLSSSKFSDQIWAVYKATSSESELCQFLATLPDSTVNNLPMRVIRDFIQRNFGGAYGEEYVPQV